MKSLRDGWYVAESDDFADGPMSREELFTRKFRGDFAAHALAWHTEIGEWRPLSRIAAQGVPVSQAGDAASRRPATTTSAIAGASLTKAERKAVRKAAAQARAAPGARPVAQQASQDDGRRLLSSANFARSIAKAGANPGAMQHSTPAVMPGAKAPAPAAKPDAAKSGAALLEAIRRLFARSIDTLTMGAAVAIGLWSVAMDQWQGDAALAEWLSAPPPGFVLLYLALLVMIPLEAIALAIAGTTPGKSLLGLTVVRRDGSRPNFAQTFGRSVEVFWRGLAVGLPLIAFFTILVAGVRHMNQGRTTWDERRGLEARVAPLTGGRWQLALVVLIVAWVAFGSGFWQELLVQTHR